jgi:hypothetical protein
MGKKTITWSAWQLKNWPQVHPVRAWIRDQARAEGYVGTPGFSAFLQENHNADVIVGKHGDWNGVRFFTEQDLLQFWSCVPAQVVQQIDAYHSGEAA